MTGERERILIERHSIERFRVYEVSEEEMERIESVSGEVGFDFNCALACITSGLSGWIALRLSPGSSSESKSIVSAATYMLVLVGLICGYRWFRNRKAMSKIFAKIRSRQVGPLGDEQHQLKPRELLSMQPQAGPSPPPQTVIPTPDAGSTAQLESGTVSVVEASAKTEG